MFGQSLWVVRYQMGDLGMGGGEGCAIEVLLLILSMRGECLELGMKSLTQNRQPKNYLLTISSPSAPPFHIEHTFLHNYEYVYNLWPAYPRPRKEVLTLILYERNPNPSESPPLLKRGEASPIITYSSQGQKFQFYGSKHEKCVLILKFRVGRERSGVTSVGGEASIGRGQGSAGDSMSLQELNRSMEQNLQQWRDEGKHYSQFLSYTDNLLQEMGAGSIRKNTKSSPRTIDEGYRVMEQPSKYSPQLLSSPQPTLLNNNRYLDSTRKKQQSSPQNPSYSDDDDNDRKVSVERLPVQKTLDISNQIQQRRRQYMHKLAATVEPQMLKDKQTHRENPNSMDTIVRTADFPATQTTARKVVRRRKSTSDNKEIRQESSFGSSGPNQLRALSSFNQPSLKPPHHQPVDLQLTNFRAVLFTKPASSSQHLQLSCDQKRLVTSKRDLKQGSLEWEESFSLRGVDPEIMMQCRVGDEKRCAGETSVKVGELQAYQGKTYRAYLYSSELAVGYLEFDCKPHHSDPSLKQQERKTVSLPQIKKTSKLSNPSTISSKSKNLSSAKPVKAIRQQTEPSDRPPFSTSPNPPRSASKSPKLSRCGSFTTKQLRKLLREKVDKSSCLSRIKQKRLRARQKAQ